MRVPYRLLGLGLAATVAARPCVCAELKDFFFGDAMFQDRKSTRLNSSH